MLLIHPPPPPPPGVQLKVLLTPPPEMYFSPLAPLFRSSSKFEGPDQSNPLSFSRLMKSA